MEQVEHTYKSRKSDSIYIARGKSDRAYLIVTGVACTNAKVLKQIEIVRKGSYDFSTVDWIARQLSYTY